MSPPAWVEDAVFYAIFPDRFGRRPWERSPPWNEQHLEPWEAPPRLRSYKGGNLGGITDQLPRLVDLGITALLLTPVFSSSSHHGYKPIDHYEVAPMLGGARALEELLQAAHQVGLKVVLDAVFNHVSWGFPAFLDVLENQERSPWRDWFLIDRFPIDASEQTQSPGYRCWNGRPSMPELNHAHPQVQAYLLEVAEHWVRRGIDGWRFDAPAEVGDAHFWRTLRERVHRINPDVYLLGEIWTEATRWLDGTQWHGVTNYPLMFIIQRFIGGDRVRADQVLKGAHKEPPLDAPAFAEVVDRLHGLYPAAVPLNFLDNADTPRFRTLVGDDAPTVRLASLLLFTLPGAPCLYYGDEVGLGGGPDPDNRRGFPSPERWDSACLEEHRRLIHLRRSSTALRRGTHRRLYAAGGLYVFERRAPDEHLVVAINAAEAEADVALQVEATDRGALRFGTGAWSEGRLLLPARSGAVFAA